MTFTSWIPGYIYGLEFEDYDIIPKDMDFDDVIKNEILASMVANNAIYKMMGE